MALVAPTSQVCMLNLGFSQWWCDYEEYGLWAVILCSLEKALRFQGTYCLHPQGQKVSQARHQQKQAASGAQLAACFSSKIMLSELPQIAKCSYLVSWKSIKWFKVEMREHHMHTHTLLWMDIHMPWGITLYFKKAAVAGLHRLPLHLEAISKDYEPEQKKYLGCAIWSFVLTEGKLKIYVGLQITASAFHNQGKANIPML
jgi:hypothetical protein